MAITKIHPIKSTLNLAIGYILDEKKTGGKLLVDSYACGYETADLEFKFTKDLSKGSSSNLAHHLIQAFEPGETTPEEAHKIGMRLAEEGLGGKYEFVLSTHIDRGHIHNHLIFNAVSFAEHNHYHSTPPKYYAIRKASDKLCEEYGLSVIRNPKGKGKSYIEHTATRQGTSWKAKLKTVIDLNISVAKDFDDFISLMEQSGYLVKRQNKNISFCTDGRERYMRSKTLGTDYTVEAIKERISVRPKTLKEPRVNKRISLIIDLQNSIKAQESKGFEHWAKIQNLKQSAKTLNFLSEHKIDSYEELEKESDTIHTDFDNLSGQIKDIENKINSHNLLIKNIETYKKLKTVMEQYKKTNDKDRFATEHRAEIILFETAINELKGAKYPPIKELKQELSELQKVKSSLYEEYKKLKSKAKEIDTVKSNVDMILGASYKSAPEKSALLE